MYRVSKKKGVLKHLLLLTILNFNLPTIFSEGGSKFLHQAFNIVPVSNEIVRDLTSYHEIGHELYTHCVKSVIF